MDNIFSICSYITSVSIFIFSRHFPIVNTLYLSIKNKKTKSGKKSDKIVDTRNFHKIKFHFFSAVIQITLEIVFENIILNQHWKSITITRLFTESTIGNVPFLHETKSKLQSAWTIMSTRVYHNCLPETPYNAIFITNSNYVYNIIHTRIYLRNVFGFVCLWINVKQTHWNIIHIYIYIRWSGPTLYKTTSDYTYKYSSHQNL